MGGENEIMKSLEEKYRQDMMSFCFNEIRSETAADFWWTDRRLVVAKRMLHDILGPGFSDTYRDGL